MTLQESLNAEHKQRLLRFDAAATRVVPKPNRTRFIPNTPYGVPKLHPAPPRPTIMIAPLPACDRDWLFIGSDDAPHKPRITTVIRVTAAHYGVSVNDLKSTRRTANLVRPRQVAMYLAKTITLRSLPEIGRKLGGRDHTTVLHAVRKVTGLLTNDPQLEADVAAIEREVLG